MSVCYYQNRFMLKWQRRRWFRAKRFSSKRLGHVKNTDHGLPGGWWGAGNHKLKENKERHDRTCPAQPLLRVPRECTGKSSAVNVAIRLRRFYENRRLIQLYTRCIHGRRRDFFSEAGGGGQKICLLITFNAFKITFTDRPGVFSTEIYI